MSTPSILGLDKQIITPFGGWKPQQYYLAEIAYSRNNSLHRSIFYSGFLTEKGFPSGYNCILSPVVDGKPTIAEIYYMKVIKLIKLDMDGYK